MDGILHNNREQDVSLPRAQVHCNLDSTTSRASCKERRGRKMPKMWAGGTY